MSLIQVILLLFAVIQLGWAVGVAAFGKNLRKAGVLGATAVVTLALCFFVGQINPAWWR